jgi:glucose/arabinose dehydrogenase
MSRATLPTTLFALIALVLAACTGPQQATGGLTLSLETTSLTLGRGDTHTIALTISRQGSLGGEVQVTASGAPDGLEIEDVVIPAGSSTGNLVVKASQDLSFAAPAPVTVTARSGTVESSAVLTVALRLSGLSVGDVALIDHPTSLAFAGDDTLLVASITDSGTSIVALKLSGTALASRSTIVDRPGRWITGIAVHDGELWFTSADANQGDPGAYSGSITRCTGSDYSTCQEVLTGLPRSAESHQPNGLAFRPGTSELYVTIGGNTNYGAPSERFGNRPEVLLGSSIAVVDVSRLGSTPLNVRPASEGGSYPINQSDYFGPPTDDLPLRLHATGLRNPYDLAWTSDGRLYASDNAGNQGLGATPGPEHGCPTPVASDPATPSDEINLIQPGGYYGHPNPARGQCVFAGGPDYQAPVAQTGTKRSSDGIAVYPGPYIGDLLAPGDIIYVNLGDGDDLARYRPGGTTGASVRGGFANPVDVAVRPSDGAIFVAEYGDFGDGPLGGRISVLSGE